MKVWITKVTNLLEELMTAICYKKKNQILFCGGAEIYF